MWTLILGTMNITEKSPYKVFQECLTQIPEVVLKMGPYKFKITCNLNYR